MSSSRSSLLSSPSSLSKRTAYWILAGLGGVLAMTMLLDVYLDWARKGEPLWAPFLENAVPLALALTVVYVGRTVYRRDGEVLRLAEMAKWALVGCVGIVFLSGSVIWLHVYPQHIHLGFFVLQLGTVGAVAGLWVGYNIAEVRQAKERMQSERDRLQRLFDGIPSPVVHGTYNDGKLNILSVNSAFEECFGHSEDEILWQDLYDLIVPENQREAAAKIDQRALEEGWAEAEVQRRTTEGPRDFQVCVARARENSSETYAIYADITEQKKRERELRVFEQVVEQANDAILVTEARPIDEPGPRIEYVNPAFEEMTGYSREEIEGKTPRVLQGPETNREALESLKEALQEGESWSGETINYRKDGDPYHLRWGITPVRKENGEIEHWMSVQRDVTEEKEQEMYLKEAQERMELALQHTGSIVFEIDLETRKVARHGSFEDFFGASSEELPTWDAFADRAVHPADRDKFFEFYRRLEKGEQDSGTLEYRTSQKTGEIRWIRTNVSVETRESHRLLRGLARDVTEQKERTRELQKAKEKAEEASRLKSTMLANMSHEIRTPLTSITGFSEVLEENLEGELQSLAKRIHSGGQRLQRTLESVLQLSKLEAGAAELDREELSMNAVVNETLEGISPEAAEKSITITRGAPETQVLGRWNEDALYRICRNLVENAIKFTPEGGHVEVRVSEEEDHAVLEVEDNGIGMNPDDVPELFRAFRQESEGLAREYEGTGLGLSIVKRLTEELEGSIDVDTEKDEGTCFTVRLPLS